MDAGEKWWSWFGLLAGKFKERAWLRWILQNWNELIGGRASSRVTNRHFDHGRSSLVFMSRSNRPYGLTCSQISGVRAA